MKMQFSQWSNTETLWCVALLVICVNNVMTLSGPNVCMVQQKYNITKRVKYRAPMSVRTYEWCFSMPPRCSKWSTEMRDLTRLETEERTAEVAVCCPGYKMRDVSCVPICPSGKMGHGCVEDCPPDKWGPNCVNECPECFNGFCVPSTGECDCEEGWQGESCEISMPTTIQAAPALMEELLTTTKSTIKTLPTTELTTPTTKVTEISTTKTAPAATTMTVISTGVTLTSIYKTESTSTTNLILKPTTSLLLYDNITTTPITTEWLDIETTEKIPKVTTPKFIYNRTETPKEGTSNNFSREHVISTTLKTSANLTSFTTPMTIPTTSTTITTPTTIVTSPTTKITNSTTTTTSTTITTFTSTSSSTTTNFSTPTSINVVTTLSTITPKATFNVMEDFIKTEITKKPEITTKNQYTTLKSKAKEIWIKPTQKVVPTFIETKVKNNHELTKVKSATYKNEAASENTTPKTIIVSIIPTSVSHATFKKIALTTASYLSHKTNTTPKFNNRTEQSFTKSMTSQVSTATPFTIKLLTTTNMKNVSTSNISTRIPQSHTTIKVTPSTRKVFLNATIGNHTPTMAILNSTMATSMSTNSMPSTLNSINKKLNSSTSLTSKTSTNKQYAHKSSNDEITTASVANKKVILSTKDETTKRYNAKSNTNETSKINVDKTKIQNVKYIITNDTWQNTHTKWNNATKTYSNPGTTQEPSDDETLHILTEPEHITAVMSDKERDHTSLDLISVISIAGGVMMAVITVAVIIVMMERCKRPRYEDVRKINDIRMQVMIDNKDVPPPYVRSIFHTPLPEPPTDSCHYQPISTLDRNLKQFMRPVVVQTISPIMLENFRGILECHYDHLPNRTNHDFGTMPTRCSVTPSMKCDGQLLRQRPLSVADYTIEALKCEAKLDMIDSTTSEPLYAEIPCWRPPSEHAIEVVNLNGEAVTEL